MIFIEILAETDYQDLYRISDGVLLVINKFKRIEYPYEPYFHVYTSDAKYKSYNKGCQKWLKVLKEDYKNKYNDIVVPKGTILYMDYPVESTSNKADWTYEIKDNCFLFRWRFHDHREYVKYNTEYYEEQSKFLVLNRSFKNSKNQN